jgi:hypothetical protein
MAALRVKNEQQGIMMESITSIACHTFVHYMDKLNTKPRFTRYWKQKYTLSGRFGIFKHLKIKHTQIAPERRQPFHASLNMHTLYTHTSVIVRLGFVKETRRQHIAKVMKSGAAQEISTRNAAYASTYSDHVLVQTISMTPHNQGWM